MESEDCFWNFHTCEICNWYRTKSASVMLQHIERHRRNSKIHTFLCYSNPPVIYKCEYCRFVTDLKVNLNEHYRIVHEKREGSGYLIPILKCYECEMCDFESYSLLVLTKHIATSKCVNYAAKVVKQNVSKKEPYIISGRRILTNNGKTWLNCNYKTSYIDRIKIHIKSLHTTHDNINGLEPFPGGNVIIRTVPIRTYPVGTVPIKTLNVRSGPVRKVHVKGVPVGKVSVNKGILRYGWKTRFKIQIKTLRIREEKRIWLEHNYFSSNNLQSSKSRCQSNFVNKMEESHPVIPLMIHNPVKEDWTKPKMDDYFCVLNMPKMYKCKICAFKADLKVILNEHCRVSHEAKTVNSYITNILRCYNCVKCDFQTYSLLVSARHKTHTQHNAFTVPNGRWFKCKYCEYKCKQKCNYTRHILCKHTEPENIIWFQCHYCLYKSKDKYCVKRHIQAKHCDSIAKPHMNRCKYCDYQTTRETILRNHIRGNHINWFEHSYFKRTSTLNVSSFCNVTKET